MLGWVARYFSQHTCKHIVADKHPGKGGGVTYKSDDRRKL